MDVLQLDALSVFHTFEDVSSIAHLVAHEFAPNFVIYDRLSHGWVINKKIKKNKSRYFRDFLRERSIIGRAVA